MCGRFALTSTPEELARRFELEVAPALAPRYNVAPGQDVWVVRAPAGTPRAAVALRWGLVPGWSQGSSAARAPSRINARAETAAEKPAFRAAFRARRGLVPASGFYEWAARGALRQPYWIHPPAGGLVAFAGLWEEWHGAEGGSVASTAILTCEARGAVRALHPRMPVILPPAAWPVWLAPDTAPDALCALLAPRDPGLVFHPVDPRVNHVEVDDPRCLEPVPEPPSQMPLL